MKLSIKILILFLNIVLSINYATATIYETTQNGNWNTTATWVNPPGEPPTGWSTTNDTVYIKHDIVLDINLSHVGYIEIQSTASLSGTSNSITINNGGVLIVNGDISVKKITLNSAALTNNAEITTVETITNNSGTITNTGIMNIGTNLASSGTIINTGTMDVVTNLYNNSNGTFTNSGTIEVGGTLTNNWSATTFSNSGTIEVTGNINNNASMTNTGAISTDNNFNNVWSSSLTNSGNIDVGNNLTNQGTLTSSDTISVGGTLTNANSSTFINNSYIEVAEDLNNYGTFTNNDEIDVGDDIYNAWNSTVTNNGTIEAVDDFTNNGTFSNTTSTDSLIIGGTLENNSNHTLINNGAITIGEDLENDGVITNNNIIIVTGDLDNNGDIDNDAGSQLLVDGTVDNSGGSIEGDGYLCSTDGTNDPTGGNTTGIDNTICGDDGSALPIELISFTGNLNNANVDLNWQTASEINNDYFTIEKSTDAINFELVAIVKGSGNSNSILNYSTTDDKPFFGTSYYRLKQTDFDGEFTYVGLITVYNKSELSISNIYPNPVNTGENLNIVTNNSELKNISIIDLQGKIILSFETFEKTSSISTNVLNKGLYLIRITDNKSVVIRKIQVN